MAKFFFISIGVQFHRSKSPRVKDYKVNFIVFVYNRENCSKSIVRGTCFYNELSIRDLVNKNGHGGKCFLE